MSEEALNRREKNLLKVPPEATESICATGGIVGHQPDPKNSLGGPTRGVATDNGTFLSTRTEIMDEIARLEAKIEEIESHDSGYSITCYNECRCYREKIAQLAERLRKL